MDSVDTVLKGQTADEQGNFMLRTHELQSAPSTARRVGGDTSVYDEAAATSFDADFARRKKIIKPITREEIEGLLKEKVGPYSEYEIQRIVELQRYFDKFTYAPKSSEGGQVLDDGTDPLFYYQSNLATIGRILDTQVEEDQYWKALRKVERKQRKQQEAAKKASSAGAELLAKRQKKRDAAVSSSATTKATPLDEDDESPQATQRQKRTGDGVNAAVVPFDRQMTARMFPPKRADDYVHRGDAEADDDIEAVGGGAVESSSSSSDDFDGESEGGSHNFYSGGESDQNDDMFSQNGSEDDAHNIGSGDDAAGEDSEEATGGTVGVRFKRKQKKEPVPRHRLLMEDSAMERQGNRRYRARLARLRDDVLNATKVAAEKEAYSKFLAMAKSIGPELKGNRPPIKTYLALLKPHMDTVIGSQNPENVTRHPQQKGLRGIASVGSPTQPKEGGDANDTGMRYYSEPYQAPPPKVNAGSSPRKRFSIAGEDNKGLAESSSTVPLRPPCVDESEALVFGYGTKNMQIRMLTAMLKFRKDQTNALKRIIRGLVDQLIYADQYMKDRFEKSAAADAKRVNELESRMDDLLREQSYLYHKIYGPAGHLAAQILIQEQAAADEQSRTMEAALGRPTAGGAAVEEGSNPKELLLPNGEVPSKNMLAEAQRVARAKKYRKEVDDAYKKIKDSEIAKAVVKAKGTADQIEVSLKRLEGEIAEQKTVALNATLHSFKTIVCRNRAMKVNRALERELMERHDLQTIHTTAKVTSALVHAFVKDSEALFTNVTPQSHGDAHGHLRDLPGCNSTGEHAATTAAARRKSLITGASPASGKVGRYEGDGDSVQTSPPPPIYHFEKKTSRIRVVDVAETLVKDMIPYIQASARAIIEKIAAHKPTGTGAPYVSPMFGTTPHMQPNDVVQMYTNSSRARRDASLIGNFYLPSDVYRHERTPHFLRHMSAATDMVRRMLCNMTTMILTTASICGGHGGGGVYIPSCGIYRYPYPQRASSVTPEEMAAQDLMRSMSNANLAPPSAGNVSTSEGSVAASSSVAPTLTVAQQRALRLYPQLAAKLTPTAQRRTKVTTSSVDIAQPTFRGDNVYYVYQVAQHLHANGVLQHMCDALFVQYMQTLENVPFTDPYGLAATSTFLEVAAAPGSSLAKKLQAAKVGVPPVQRLPAKKAPKLSAAPSDAEDESTNENSTEVSSRALSYSAFSSMRRSKGDLNEVGLEDHPDASSASVPIAVQPKEYQLHNGPRSEGQKDVQNTLGTGEGSQGASDATVLSTSDASRIQQRPNQGPISTDRGSAASSSNAFLDTSHSTPAHSTNNVVDQINGVPAAFTSRPSTRESVPTERSVARPSSTNHRVGDEGSSQQGVSVADVGMQTEITMRALDELLRSSSGVNRGRHSTSAKSSRSNRVPQTRGTSASTASVQGRAQADPPVPSRLPSNASGHLAGSQSESDMDELNFDATVAMHAGDMLMSSGSSRSGTLRSMDFERGVSAAEGFATLPAATRVVETSEVGSETVPCDVRNVASQAYILRDEDRLSSEASVPPLPALFPLGLTSATPRDTLSDGSELRNDNHNVVADLPDVRRLLVHSGELLGEGSSARIQLTSLARAILGQLSPGYLFYCLPTLEINEALRLMATARGDNKVPSLLRKSPSTRSEASRCPFFVAVCIRSFGALWRTTPTGTAQAVSLLRTLLRSETSLLAGIEHKCEQEMFVAAFPSVTAAMRFVNAIQEGSMVLPYHAYPSSQLLLMQSPAMNEIPMSILSTLPSSPSLYETSSECAGGVLVNLGCPVYELSPSPSLSGSALFEAAVSSFRAVSNSVQTAIAAPSQPPAMSLLSRLMTTRHVPVQELFAALQKHLRVQEHRSEGGSNLAGGNTEELSASLLIFPHDKTPRIAKERRPSALHEEPTNIQAELNPQVSSVGGLLQTIGAPSSSTSSGYEGTRLEHRTFLQRGLPLAFGLGCSLGESLAAASDAVRTSSFCSTTPFTIPSPKAVSQVNDGDECYFLVSPPEKGIAFSSDPSTATRGLDTDEVDSESVSLRLEDGAAIPNHSMDVFKPLSTAQPDGLPVTIAGALLLASCIHAEALTAKRHVEDLVSYVRSTSASGTTQVGEDGGVTKSLTKHEKSLASAFSEFTKAAGRFVSASETHVLELASHVSMGICASTAFGEVLRHEAKSLGIQLRPTSHESFEVLTPLSRGRWEYLFASELAMLVSSRRWEAVAAPASRSLISLMSSAIRQVFGSCPKLILDRCPELVESASISLLAVDAGGFVTEKEKKAALVNNGKHAAPSLVDDVLQFAANANLASLHRLVVTAGEQVPPLKRGIQLYEKLLSSAGTHPLQLIAVEANAPNSFAAFGPNLTLKGPWSVSNVVAASIARLHSSDSHACSSLVENRVALSIEAPPHSLPPDEDDPFQPSTSDTKEERETPHSLHANKGGESIDKAANKETPSEGKRLTFVVIEIENSDAVLQDALGSEIIDSSFLGSVKSAGTGVDELTLARSPGAGKAGKAKNSTTADATVVVTYDDSRVQQAFYDHFEPHIYPPMLTHNCALQTLPSPLPRDQLHRRLTQKGRALRNELDEATVAIVNGIQGVALGGVSRVLTSSGEASLPPRGPSVFACLNTSHFNGMRTHAVRHSEEYRSRLAADAIDTIVDAEEGGASHPQMVPPPALPDQERTTSHPDTRTMPQRLLMFACESPVDALAIACEAHHIALNCDYSADILGRIPTCAPKYSSASSAAVNARLARDGITTGDAPSAIGGSENDDVPSLMESAVGGGEVPPGGARLGEGILWRGLKVRAAVAMATHQMKVVEPTGAYVYGPEVAFAANFIYGGKFGETLLTEEVKDIVTDISPPPTVRCTFLDHQNKLSATTPNQPSIGGAPNRSNSYSWWMVPSSVQYATASNAQTVLQLGDVLGKTSSSPCPWDVDVNAPKLNCFAASPKPRPAYVCLPKGLTARWQVLERVHRQEEFELKRIANLGDDIGRASPEMHVSPTPFYSQMSVGGVALTALQLAQLTANSASNVGEAATSSLLEEGAGVVSAKSVCQSVMAVLAPAGIPLTSHREAHSLVARAAFASSSSAVLSLLDFVRAHPLILACALREDSVQVLSNLERRMTKLLVEHDRAQIGKSSSRNDTDESKTSGSPSKASKREFNESATSQRNAYSRNFEFLKSVVNGVKAEVRTNVLHTLREAILSATATTLGSLFESPDSLHETIVAASLKIHLALRTALVSNQTDSGKGATAGGVLEGGGIYSGPNLSSHPDFYHTLLPAAVSGDFSYLLQQYSLSVAGCAASTDVSFIPIPTSEVEKGLIGSWLADSLLDSSNCGTIPKREPRMLSGAQLLVANVAYMRPEYRRGMLSAFLPLYARSLSESAARALVTSTMIFGDEDEHKEVWAELLNQQFASTADPSLQHQQHKPTKTLSEILHVDPKALLEHQDFVLDRFDASASGVSREGVLRGSELLRSDREMVVGEAAACEEMPSPFPAVSGDTATSNVADFVSWPTRHLKQSRLRKIKCSRYPGVAKFELLRERLGFNALQETAFRLTPAAACPPATTAVAATFHLWNEVFVACVVHHIATNPDLRKILNREIVRQQPNFAVRTATSTSTNPTDPTSRALQSSSIGSPRGGPQPVGPTSTYSLPLLVVLQPVVEALMRQAREVTDAFELVVHRAAVQCDGIVRRCAVDHEERSDISAWVEYIVATHEHEMWLAGCPTEPSAGDDAVHDSITKSLLKRTDLQTLGVSPPPLPPRCVVELPDPIKALHFSHQLTVAMSKIPIVIRAKRRAQDSHRDVSSLSSPLSVFNRPKGGLPLSSQFGTNARGVVGTNNMSSSAVLHFKCLNVPVDAFLHAFGECSVSRGGELVTSGPRVISCVFTAPVDAVSHSIQFDPTTDRVFFGFDVEASHAASASTVRKWDSLVLASARQTLSLASHCDSHDGDHYLRIAATTTERAVEGALSLLEDACRMRVTGGGAALVVCGGETLIHSATVSALSIHPLLVVDGGASVPIASQNLLQPFFFFRRRSNGVAAFTTEPLEADHLRHPPNERYEDALMSPRMFDNLNTVNNAALSVGLQHCDSDAIAEPNFLKQQHSVMFLESDASASRADESNILTSSREAPNPLAAALRKIEVLSVEESKGLSLYTRILRCRAALGLVAHSLSASSLTPTCVSRSSAFSVVCNALLSPLSGFLQAYYGQSRSGQPSSSKLGVPATTDRHPLVQHVQSTLNVVMLLSMGVTGVVLSPCSTSAQTASARGAVPPYTYDVNAVLAAEAVRRLNTTKEIIRLLHLGPNNTTAPFPPSLGGQQPQLDLVSQVGDAFVCEADIVRAVEMAEEAMQPTVARPESTSRDQGAARFIYKAPRQQLSWEHSVIQAAAARSYHKKPPSSPLRGRRRADLSLFADTLAAHTSPRGDSAGDRADAMIASVVANPTSATVAATPLAGIVTSASPLRPRDHSLSLSMGSPNSRQGIATSPIRGGGSVLGMGRSFRGAESGRTVSTPPPAAAMATVPTVTTSTDAAIFLEVQKQYRQLCGVAAKAAKVMGYPQSTIAASDPSKLDGGLRNGLKTFAQLGGSAASAAEHAQLRGVLNVAVQDVQRLSRTLLEEILVCLSCRPDKSSRFHRSQQTLLSIPANNESAQLSDGSSDDEGGVRKRLGRSGTMVSFRRSQLGSAGGSGLGESSDSMGLPTRRKSVSRGAGTGGAETSSYDNINQRLFKKVKQIAAGPDVVYNIGPDGKVVSNNRGDPKMGFQLSDDFRSSYNVNDGGADVGRSEHRGGAVVRSTEYRPGAGHDILSVQLRERLIVELEEELQMLRAMAAERSAFGGSETADDVIGGRDARKDFQITLRSNASDPTSSLPPLTTPLGAATSSAETPLLFKPPDFMGMLTAFKRPPVKSSTADGSTSSLSQRKRGINQLLPLSRARTTGHQGGLEAALVGVGRPQQLPPILGSNPSAGDWVTVGSDPTRVSPSDHALVSTNNPNPLSIGALQVRNGSPIPGVHQIAQLGAGTAPSPLPSGDLSSSFVVATINPASDMRGDLQAPFSRHFNNSNQAGKLAHPSGGHPSRGLTPAGRQLVSKRSLMSPIPVQPSDPARTPDVLQPQRARPANKSLDPDIEGR